MTQNEGLVDRWLRVIIAAVAWWLAAWIGYGTAGGITLLVVAGILAVTALAGYCPLYALAHMSTVGGAHRAAGGTGGHGLPGGHPAR